ncbi:hypothetical protein D9M68_275550 [compost metagenome]|uniref:hypothetical protein n=1 Tax=unclassified Ensifer TaxID=2633371 RepID=UPI00071C9F98
MAKRTYKGSCHCGKVRYEATFDLDAGTTKCNCAFCINVAAWMMSIRPSSPRCRWNIWMAATTDGMKDLSRFAISDGRTEQLLSVDNILSMWQMHCISFI